MQNSVINGAVERFNDMGVQCETFTYSFEFRL